MEPYRKRKDHGGAWSLEDCYGRGHLHPIGYDLVTQPHIIAREAGKHSLLESQGRRGEHGFLVSRGREQQLLLGPFSLCWRLGCSTWANHQGNLIPSPFSSFFSHLMCEKELQGPCSCEKKTQAQVWAKRRVMKQEKESSVLSYRCPERTCSSSPSPLLITMPGCSHL